MTVSSSVVFQGVDSVIIDVAASADGDTVSSAIAHGLGAAPAEFTATALTAAGALSTWAFTTVGASTFVVTKSTATGSGAVPAQVRLILKRPNTIGR
jgi:DNA recombination-dependent growth factor C